MPQTIAIQRGTTTVSGAGTSSSTLFTQSATGLATRVIVNQLTFSFPSVASGGRVVIGVYHASSGGQTSLLGTINQAQTGIGYRAVQFIVGSVNGFTANAIGASNIFSQLPVIGHTQAGADMSETSPANINYGYSDGSTHRISYIPSNFYIGPSDSVTFKAQAISDASNPLTVTCSYSFTTITETA